MKKEVHWVEGVEERLLRAVGWQQLWKKKMLKALAWQESGWDIRYVRGCWARGDRVSRLRLFQSGYIRNQTYTQHRTTPSSQKTASVPFVSCQK